MDDTQGGTDAKVRMITKQSRHMTYDKCCTRTKGCAIKFKTRAEDRKTFLGSARYNTLNLTCQFLFISLDSSQRTGWKTIIYGVLVVMTTMLHITDTSKRITEPTVYLAHTDTYIITRLTHGPSRSIYHVSG